MKTDSDTDVDSEIYPRVDQNLNHSRIAQAHQAFKGAAVGAKDVRKRYLGGAFAAQGGMAKGTKLQPGTNFAQNVAIYQQWSTWYGVLDLPKTMKMDFSVNEKNILTEIGECLYGEGACLPQLVQRCRRSIEIVLRNNVNSSERHLNTLNKLRQFCTAPSGYFLDETKCKLNAEKLDNLAKRLGKQVRNDFTVAM